MCRDRKRHCILPHTVDVWTVKRRDLIPHVHCYRRLLSTAEIRRAQQYRHDLAMELFVLGRAVLRILLSNYLHCQPRLIDIRCTEYGKPYIENTGIEFNLTHSDDMIAIAIAAHQIGIDIERIKTAEPLMQIAHRIMTTQEYTAFNALDPAMKNSAFYQWWTRKEAYLKAIGKGLLLPLSACEITVGQSVKGAGPVKVGLCDNVALFDLNIHHHYAATLAAQPEVTDICIHQYLHSKPASMEVTGPGLLLGVKTPNQ